MLLLTTLIHTVFAGIFFFFGRYIEMAIVLTFFLIFVSKIIPPLDVIKKPAFLKVKTPESTTLEQSIYVSSGILFYTALVGISLGVSNILGVPMSLHLMHYCIFFLTSVIFGLYFLFYPKNPNIFILFRTHNLIVAGILGVFVLGWLLFSLFPLEPLALFNLLLITIGLSMVIILDRNAFKGAHILSVYFFIMSVCNIVLGMLSFFGVSFPAYIFGLLGAISGLYIFFPEMIEKAYLRKHIHHLLWHFSNCILALSWAIFFYLFWALFWGYMDDQLIVSCSLFLVLGLWLWVYNTDDKNPLFFSWALAVLGVFYGFMTFQILPQIFWMITVALFLFSGAILLLSRFFRNTPEELILAGGSVIFLCSTDLVLIFQDNNLFSLSTLFFFQSFLWYGAYEIFHRQAVAKNGVL